MKVDGWNFIANNKRSFGISCKNNPEAEELTSDMTFINLIICEI